MLTDIERLASARLKNVITKVKKSGGVVFSSSKLPYNLNIVGIRSAQRTADAFDDTLAVFWFDGKGWNEHFFYNFTTDPGAYWLERLGTSRGTAILKSGQYRGVYKIDLHGGKYKALCQRLGDVRVYRDANRDKILDMKPGSVEQGKFGINIHRAALNGSSIDVGQWSAGCQVFADSSDFDLFIQLCENAAMYWGNQFTYTLIEDF
jgi:hypothetical protein